MLLRYAAGIYVKVVFDIDKKRILPGPLVFLEGMFVYLYAPYFETN